MDNKEIEQLVNGMPFDDNEKKSLLSDLENGVFGQQVLAKMRIMLVGKEDALDNTNPAAAEAHEAAEREYEEAVNKASGQFEDTMVQIDKEADEVGQEMMRRLDQAHTEEVKESI